MGIECIERQSTFLVVADEKPSRTTNGLEKSKGPLPRFAKFTVRNTKLSANDLKAAAFPDKIWTRLIYMHLQLARRYT